MVRLGLVASLFAAAANAVSMDHVQARNTITRVPGAYIFEFEEDNDRTDFYSQVASGGLTRMEFDCDLFKGASIQFNDLDRAHELAAQMLELPAVKTMYPVQVYSLSKPKLQWKGNPGQQVKNMKKRSILGFINQLLGNMAAGAAGPSTDNGSQNLPTDQYSVHTMTQVDKLRAEGFTGKGIKIAVVDSGIDYTHPALGGCFGPGCLVAGGTDFVGDDYDGTGAPQPDDDPMDCEGHGTHVAGIIAAQQNELGFTGAAPDVTLLAYRAFGCSAEGVGSDVLIAAYSRAYADGANIISASIAAPSGWSEEAWSVVVSRIVAKGVPCVVAAGNAGESGQFYASAGASGKGVSAVASFDDTHIPTLVNVSQYTVNASSSIDFGTVDGTPAAWGGVKLPLWALNLDTTIANDGCQTFPSSTPDLSNYVVLLRRGTCSFDKKAKFAQAAGAKYVMFYNNDVKSTVPDATSVKGIEAVGIVTDRQGEEWINLLKTGSNVVLEMSSGANSTLGADYSENKLSAGAVSTFSSWGPTWEMDLKPQFGCPGGHILSTYPVAKGSYAIQSGTSMATPLMAGIFALIAQVRGSLEPQLIENLLSSTANPQLYNDGSTWSNYLAPVPQQGAGLVQAYEAAFARVILSPSSLSFNDTDNFVPSRNFTLTNTGTDTVQFQISHVPSVSVFTFRKSLTYPSTWPNEVTQEHATVEFSENTVTIGPGESAVIEVLPTPPQNLTGERLPVWSGWVAINGTDGSSMSIPYQGLTGSLHNSTVLTDHDSWISNSKSRTLAAVDANVTFSLPKAGTLTAANINETDAILPNPVTFLALGTLELRADVVPIKSDLSPNLEVPQNGSIGQLDTYPALANPMGTSSLTWTGQLANGSYAPTGMYKIVYRALRIFGDPSNESDWDVSETTPFGIKYAT